MTFPTCKTVGPKNHQQRARVMKIRGSGHALSTYQHRQENFYLSMASSSPHFVFLIIFRQLDFHSAMRKLFPHFGWEFQKLFPILTRQREQNRFFLLFSRFPPQFRCLTILENCVSPIRHIHPMCR